VLFKVEVMTHYWVIAVVLSVLVMLLEGIWVFTRTGTLYTLRPMAQILLQGNFQNPLGKVAIAPVV
jgi:hypothetical protein